MDKGDCIYPEKWIHFYACHLATNALFTLKIFETYNCCTSTNITQSTNELSEFQVNVVCTRTSLTKAHAFIHTWWARKSAFWPQRELVDGGDKLRPNARNLSSRAHQVTWLDRLAINYFCDRVEAMALLWPNSAPDRFRMGRRNAIDGHL